MYQISLFFRNPTLSLFMLRVFFVPFDRCSLGNLSLEVFYVSEEYFFPPDLLTDPSLVRPYSECDRKVIKNKIFIRKSASNMGTG